MNYCEACSTPMAHGLPSCSSECQNILDSPQQRRAAVGDAIWKIRTVILRESFRIACLKRNLEAEEGKGD